MVAAGMMSRHGMTDSDAASQQQRHLQSSAGHVLHFGNLINHFAKRIIDEVDKHEIDDRVRSGHGSTARETHETAFTDGCIAKSHSTIFVVQSSRRGKIATSLSDAFAHDKDSGIAFHFEVQSFQRSGGPGDFTSGLCGRRQYG